MRDIWYISWLYVLELEFDVESVGAGHREGPGFDSAVNVGTADYAGGFGIVLRPVGDAEEVGGEYAERGAAQESGFSHPFFREPVIQAYLLEFEEIRAERVGFRVVAHPLVFVVVDVDVFGDGVVPVVGDGAVAVVDGVHAFEHQSVLTPGQRVFQLALVREREVGHREGVAAHLRRELRREREVLVPHGGSEARLPVGIHLGDPLVGVLDQRGVTRLRVDDRHARAVDHGAVFVGVGGAFRGADIVAAVNPVHLLADVGVDEGAAADGHAHRGLQRRRGVPALVQFAQLVLVAGPVAVDLPQQVAGLHGAQAERDFDTFVLHAPGVHHDFRGARFGALRHAENLVGGGVLVECDVEIEPVAEEFALESDFPALHVLRIDVGVLQRAGEGESAGQRGLGVGVVERVGRRVVTDVGPRGADFQHVHVRRIDLERLVEQDAGADRRIGVAPFSRVKCRGPVCAAGDVEEIGIVPAEVYEFVDALKHFEVI